MNVGTALRRCCAKTTALDGDHRERRCAPAAGMRDALKALVTTRVTKDKIATRSSYWRKEPTMRPAHTITLTRGAASASESACARNGDCAAVAAKG